MQRNSTAHRTIHADIATPCRQGLTTEALGSGRERAERRAPLSASANSSKPRDSPPHPRGRRRSVRLCQLPRSWHRPPPAVRGRLRPMGLRPRCFQTRPLPRQPRGPVPASASLRPLSEAGSLAVYGSLTATFFPSPQRCDRPLGGLWDAREKRH